MPGGGVPSATRDVALPARSQTRLAVADVLPTPEPGVVVETFGGPAVVEHQVAGNDDVATGPRDRPRVGVALRRGDDRPRYPALARAVQPVRRRCDRRPLVPHRRRRPRAGRSAGHRGPAPDPRDGPAARLRAAAGLGGDAGRDAHRPGRRRAGVGPRGRPQGARGLARHAGALVVLGVPRERVRVGRGRGRRQPAGEPGPGHGRDPPRR